MEPDKSTKKPPAMQTKTRMLSLQKETLVYGYVQNPIHYYCNHCNKEKYNEELCLTCGELLPREYDWNDILSRGGMCDATCQYMILICDWVRGGTPFKTAFNRALKRLQHYSHDEDEFKRRNHQRNTILERDYYQQLCPIQQEQEQYLAQINTYFCKNCLIPCQNQDLERKIEIKNQQSQNQSINQQDLPNEIIPERAHPTDAGFDLCYLEDQSTMLLPRSITKIDLKIVVEIPPGIMNNSEKPYTIESKEKIAQAIFLLLVKIGKFVPMENYKELSQTMRGTFGFGLTEKGIEANITKTIEEKGKVIKTEQSIMLLPYGKSEIRIKKTIKEKDLIFKPYSETCQQFLIGLTNLFILADKAQ
ncbi:hypothetical protein G9A89_016768 [Geosiphon pyriformis]|nr:hypothetical protein G9A89_016768 [Geosiphon pyriformis]